MSDTRSPDFFSFAMGEFEATFPTDRRYAKNHMWAQRRGSEKSGGADTWRFGLSAYAVRLLQDVYFLEWEFEPPSSVEHRQMIGAIESKKAESDLYAPISGTLTRFNEELLSDPSAINVDKYAKGWLFELLGSGDSLLSPEDYIQHLDRVWEVTQRTI